MNAYRPLRPGFATAVLVIALLGSVPGHSQGYAAGADVDEAQRALIRRYESHVEGRMRDYIREAERERSRNPSDPMLARSLAVAYDAVGKTRAAFAEVERGYRLPDASREAKFELAIVGQLVALGARDRDRVVFWLTEMARVNPSIDGSMQRLIARMDTPEALASHQAKLRDPATTEQQQGTVAHWLAYYGDAEGALEALRLERMAIGRNGASSLWHSVFREVRALPGFKQLVRDIGLVDQWRRSGWGDFCKPVGAEDFDCGSGPAGKPAVSTGTDGWQVVRSHRVRRVQVDRDVHVEVVDWGGTGRPLVLLAGLGGTAHVFDELAPKLTDRYHVYGVTRRGFGVSDAPADGYGSDRLADDVLAVLDVLKLDRPVLAGHSFAGAELSSIGSRFPERVAGLIYLDAHYDYAFADPDLEATMAAIRGSAAAAEVPPGSGPLLPPDLVAEAMLAGKQKYAAVGAPLLAIMAGKQKRQGPTSKLFAESLDIQKRAIRKAAPSARLVYLAEADHAVFASHEKEVLEEMHAFIASLQ